MIAQEEIGEYLHRLSSREPTPGGGAAGGVHLAQGAALLAMVARFTSGPKHIDVQDRAEGIARRADALMDGALSIADSDERLFSALIASYQLPRGDEQTNRRRSEAIAEATTRATEPQLQTVGMALEIIELADDLVQIGNRNVLSDVSAAAEAARAALGTAIVTLEINRNSVKEESVRARLSDAVREAEAGMGLADKVTLRVRQELAP